MKVEEFAKSKCRTCNRFEYNLMIRLERVLTCKWLILFNYWNTVI